MAKTVNVVVLLAANDATAVEIRGIANDHVEQAAEDLRKEFARVAGMAERRGYQRGITAYSSLSGWVPLREREGLTKPVEVVKVPSHSHWWKRNG